MPGGPSQDLGRVAARLAVDGNYRERCRQGLQAAVAGQSNGTAPPADVLGRVRRLNQYLSTGLMLDDGDDVVSGGGNLTPLPWQQPAQAPPALPAASSTRAQPPPLAAEHSGSETDSDLEESQGPEGEDLAALLAAAQAAVERRQSKAALSIQCAWRQHTSQLLLQSLQAQRLAANRLVARLLSGAYQRVCGPQRRLAQQALVARLGSWRRRLWRAQQRRRRQQEQHSHTPEAAGTAQELQLDEQGQQVACTQHQAPEEQAAQRAAGDEQAPLPPTAEHGSPLVASQPPPPAAVPGADQQSPSLAQVLPPAPVPAQAAAAAAAQERLPAQPQPPPSPLAPLLPQPEAPQAERNEPPPAACTLRHTPPRSPALPRSVSSRGGVSASLAGQALPVGCLQQCLPPPPRPATASSGSFKGQHIATPPRSSTPDSTSCGWDSPPCTASSSGRTSRGHDGSGQAGATNGTGAHLCRRMSSIQLLESVQLGVDGAAGSVTSQAALEARERVAGRVADLQRSASSGTHSGGGGGSKRSIRRVCSSRPTGSVGEGVPSTLEPLEGCAE